MMQERFLTPSKVAEITTLHRATIYRKVASGEMPQPVRLSERRIAFRESEILNWMAERELA